jgi:glyoxylase-like metal-dependent hydrolase (beta-lactamase superfamily II)
LESSAAFCGAEVACFGPAASLFGDYQHRASTEDDSIAGLMLGHGVDPELVRATRMFARLSAHLAEPLAVTLPVSDGDVLVAGGRSLRVLHRPGHSPSDILLYDDGDGLVVSGDHLLGRVSSNALLALPLGRRAAPSRAAAAAVGVAELSGGDTRPPGAEGPARPR